MDEILDKLGWRKYLTTIDLAKVFNQIRMDESSIAKTAFSTERGHMGTSYTPAPFHRCMNNLLGDIIYLLLEVSMGL